MKILHWAKFYPPEWGGTEGVTYDLATAGARTGASCEVIAFSRAGSCQGEVEGVLVHRAKVRAYVNSQPLSLRWARLALHAARSADVIHIHAPNLLAAALLPLVSRKKRIIVHWHTDLVGKGLLGALAHPLELYMAHRARWLLASSASYADASPVLRRFSAKTLAVPLGIGDPLEAPTAPAIPGYIDEFVRDRPIALAVGRSVPYKGFGYLVRAAAATRCDIAIVIVGVGPLRDEYRRLIDELGVGDRVLLAGRLAESDLRSLFRAASIYVMSSVMRSEAFGLVLLEAMAHGLPTIATDVPGSGVSWVAGNGETGLIVPPLDPDALAAAIDRLIGDAGLRQSFAVRSRARYERLFTRDRMLERVLPLYREQPQGS